MQVSDYDFEPTLDWAKVYCSVEWAEVEGVVPNYESIFRMTGVDHETIHRALATLITTGHIIRHGEPGERYFEMPRPYAGRHSDKMIQMVIADQEATNRPSVATAAAAAER